MSTRAFVALGSNAPDARACLARGLAGLAEGGDRVAAVSLPVRAPYESAPGQVAEGLPSVSDVVVEVVTARDPAALLARLHALEGEAGRVRDASGVRTLDADLLAWGDRVADALPGPRLPHPRALERAFVLEPWASIAPVTVVPGTGRTVFEHRLRLEAAHPERFARLETEPPLEGPGAAAVVRRLEDGAALDAWRRTARGVVGVVPTMGALHEGHAALVRRARAECDAVLATIFVNPLQFGPGEDLDRYPRTLEADLALLAREGADAAWLPAASTLYPEGYATRVDVAGPAEGLEGDLRPGHFSGVATVVLKLWLATRPDRIYFGRKDAQQLAVVRRMARDLGLAGAIVPCPIVRDREGLALSSRNRYLDPSARRQALTLPRALEALVREAYTTDAEATALEARARDRMVEAGLAVDYVRVADPNTLARDEARGRPLLVVAAARAGTTRLLDNRWLVRPLPAGAS